MNLDYHFPFNAMATFGCPKCPNPPCNPFSFFYVSLHILLPPTSPSVFLFLSLFPLSLSSWQPFSKARCSVKSSEPCPALHRMRPQRQLTCP